MIPSYNLKETARFFQDLLGFRAYRNEETYVVLIKDNQAVHLLRAGADIGEMEFYMDVDDIEEVWSRMQGKLDGIKHKEPFDREYGMREIHVIVPYTRALLFIGQAIAD